MSELNSHLFSVKLLVISHSVVVSLLSQSMSHSKLIKGSIKDEKEDEEGLKFVLGVYAKLKGGKKLKRSFAELVGA